MAVVTFKCKNCGGDVRFDPNTGQYICEFCNSVFTQAEMEEAPVEDQKEQVVENGAVIYNCPSCGAEIVTEETTAATLCFYCHNPVILSGRLDGAYVPDYIVPFAVSREEAISKFMKWVGTKKYVPKDFFSKEQLQLMTGVYFPFWVMNADVAVQARARGEKHSISRAGNQERTERHIFDLDRSGDVHVDHLSKNALKKADRELVEAVLPFEAKDMKKFAMQYLSGFQAEKRDLEKADLKDEMERDMYAYAEKAVRDSVSTEYAKVDFSEMNLRPRKINWEYVLFPVWALTYKKKGDDKTYYYALNGQTGKIAGELPVDDRKLTLHAVIIGIIVCLVFLIGGYLI